MTMRGSLAVLGLLAASCSGAGPVAPPIQLADADRYYSADKYDDFVQRALPVNDLASRTANATLIANLHATVDPGHCGDDNYRHEQIVLLGVEGPAEVAVATQLAVNIRYPDDHIQCGEPHWSTQYLSLHDPKGRMQDTPDYALREIGAEDSVQFPDAKTALFRRFGDNDVALVYFPIVAGTPFASPIPAIGVVNPTQIVGQFVSSVPDVFGIKFVLMTPRSLDFLRAENASANHQTVEFAEVAVAIAAVALVGPSLGIDCSSLLGGSLSGNGVIATALGNALALGHTPGFFADAIPIGLRLLGTWAEQSGALDSTGPAGKLAVHLLLAQLPEPSTTEGQAAAALIQRFAGVAFQSVTFAGDDGHEAGALLFQPQTKMNLNYELVRRGLAKLDVSNAEALDRYPEFIEAAQQALIDGVGGGGRWKSDPTYVQAIQAARDSRSGWRYR